MINGKGFWFAVNTIAQKRQYGSRAFSDNILYAVIERGVTITAKNVLTNLIRAYWIINANDDNNKGRKSSFSKAKLIRIDMANTVENIEMFC